MLFETLARSSIRVFPLQLGTGLEACANGSESGTIANRRKVMFCVKLTSCRRVSHVVEAERTCTAEYSSAMCVSSCTVQDVLWGERRTEVPRAMRIRRRSGLQFPQATSNFPTGALGGEMEALEAGGEGALDGTRQLHCRFAGKMPWGINAYLKQVTFWCCTCTKYAVRRTAVE